MTQIFLQARSVIHLGMILIYLRNEFRIITGTGPRHDEQNRTGNQKKKAYSLRPIFAVPVRPSIQHTLCAEANIYNHWRQRKFQKKKEKMNGDNVLTVVRVTHNIIPAVQRPQMPAKNNRNGFAYPIEHCSGKKNLKPTSEERIRCSK